MTKNYRPRQLGINNVRPSQVARSANSTNVHTTRTDYTPTEVSEISGNEILSRGSLIDASDPSASLEYKKESKPEQDSRIRIHEQEEKFKLIKELVILLIVILAAIGILIFCVATIADINAIPENRQAAWSVITLILGSFLGYLSGKASK